MFRFDDDEIAEVVTEHPDLPEAALAEPARACPSGATTLHDENGQDVGLY